MRAVKLQLAAVTEFWAFLHHFWDTCCICVQRVCVFTRLRPVNARRADECFAFTQNRAGEMLCICLCSCGWPSGHFALTVWWGQHVVCTAGARWGRHVRLRSGRTDRILPGNLVSGSIVQYSRGTGNLHPGAIRVRIAGPLLTFS